MAAGTIIALLVLALLLVAREGLFAQVEGERGIAPIASSGDIDVGGIEINVVGKDGEDARQKGWRMAIRKAWEKVDGPDLPDSRLEQMVSAIVIEREQIGPRRYIAKLGVIFDRTRAGGLLGTDGPKSYSAPMLLIPVLNSGGARTVFETRNAWQRAWAEYQTGTSAIDYVRPSGAGGDSLLLTYGQTGRRSRAWWRNILDQFGAADVLVAIARLDRQWPGGPVEGNFIARFGPDNVYLDSFKLTAPNDGAIPEMFERARVRFDKIYSQALIDGKLKPDPTLTLERTELDPALKALLQAARESSVIEEPIAIGESAGPTPEAAVGTYTIQFATPDAGAVDATLAAVRAAPGVRGASTTSIALGGTSVMAVNYSGSLQGLADALRARGYRVVVGNGALSIRR